MTLILIFCGLALGFFTVKYFLDLRFFNDESSVVMVADDKSVFGIGQNDEKTLISLIETLMPVAAVVRDENNNVLGSGFLTSNSSFITARHVLENFDQKYFADFGEGLIFELRFEDEKKDLDLVYLDLVGENLPKEFASFSNQEVDLGEEIFSIGYQGGYGNSVVKGVVSGKNRYIEVENSFGQLIVSLSGLLQVDMNVSEGMSGAPVFNMNGEVIGMIVAVSKDDEGVGFIIEL
ncbi:hypothetical protein A2335_02485 [Candidatus Peregrinibacteria bacterium RIFOXYB2_FULL_32_7]|nr:MAG: hypothetical protein A2335_02485 [Candidatus Peregrinibacteria bacterium RIFOXYB2_FULL_32_7]